MITCMFLFCKLKLNLKRMNMKKRPKFILVVIFASIVSYGIYTNQKSKGISDLLLANIEAMALDEVDMDCTDCYLVMGTICLDWGWGGCRGYYHRR